MLALLSRAGAFIFENAHIFETAVALQVLNSLSDQAQELLDFAVAGRPQMLVVAGVFEQQLVRADRSHAVIETVAATRGLAFNPVDRCGMNHRAGRPGTPRQTRQRSDDLELR